MQRITSPAFRLDLDNFVATTPMKGICATFAFINILLTLDPDANERFISTRIDWLESVATCILGYKNCCCTDMRS